MATRRSSHRRSIVTAETAAPVEVAAVEAAHAEDTAKPVSAPIVAPRIYGKPDSVGMEKFSPAPPPTGYEGLRATPNAWWCPVHDRAMPITDPPTACDIGHELPKDFQH